MPRKTSKNGNGEGSIGKRSDGRWYAAITVGRNVDGSQKRRFFYGRIRAEVIQKRDNARNELASGEYIDPHKITMHDWMQTWLWEYKKPFVKPKHLRAMNRRIGSILKKGWAHCISRM